MDSSNKNSSNNRNNTTQTTNYNPWNLIFSPRNRTESESSVSSVNSNSQNCQSGPQFRTLQRQTSKNEEYLWIICNDFVNWPIEFSKDNNAFGHSFDSLFVDGSKSNRWRS